MMLNPTLMAHATQAHELDGWTQVYKRKDGVSLQGIYVKEEMMLVGIGGTRDNIADWLRNLRPEVEAITFAPVVQRLMAQFQPTTIVFAGHSQGGAHAEVLAASLGGTAYTFGGLPTGRQATHFLCRKDPMAWVPWWLLGLSRNGRKIKLGGPGFDGKSHLIEAYVKALESWRDKKYPQ